MRPIIICKGNKKSRNVGIIMIELKSINKMLMILVVCVSKRGNDEVYDSPNKKKTTNSDYIFHKAYDCLSFYPNDQTEKMSRNECLVNIAVTACCVSISY